jgi:hypothetical protein
VKSWFQLEKKNSGTILFPEYISENYEMVDYQPLSYGLQCFVFVNLLKQSFDVLDALQIINELILAGAFGVEIISLTEFEKIFFCQRYYFVLHQ